MTLIESIAFARFLGLSAGKSKRRDRRLTGRLKAALRYFARRKAAEIRAARKRAVGAGQDTR